MSCLRCIQGKACALGIFDSHYFCQTVWSRRSSQGGVPPSVTPENLPFRPLTLRRKAFPHRAIAFSSHRPQQSFCFCVVLVSKLVHDVFLEERRGVHASEYFPRRESIYYRSARQKRARQQKTVTRATPTALIS